MNEILEPPAEARTAEDLNMSIGLVGYLEAKHIRKLKKALAKVPTFRLVYFKYSDERLWIVTDSEKRKASI